MQRIGPYAGLSHIVWRTVCLLIGSYFAPISAIGQTPPLAVVGVKLIKSDPRPGASAFRVQLPADCADCSLVSDPAYHGENPREIYFHVSVPSSRAVIPNIRVDVGENGDPRCDRGEESRPIYCRQWRCGFRSAGGCSARSSTVEVQTSLEWLRRRSPHRARFSRPARRRGSTQPANSRRCRGRPP